VSCGEVSAIDLSGKFIVFEGLDFTGKSTQVRLLSKRLEELGIPVVCSQEPGGTTIGEKIRTLLLTPEHDKMLPLSELLLFMVSRAQHTKEVICPALQEGRTVISSRYRLSSLAYQGHGRGLDLDLIRSLNEHATKRRKADVTLLIDIPAETALARKGRDVDRIEREDLAFYKRVREGFLSSIAGDPSAHVLDGTMSIPKIASRVADILGI